MADKPTILIVDDEELCRILPKIYLEKNGNYNILLAENGDEAMQIASVAQPNGGINLLLTDTQFPYQSREDPDEETIRKLHKFDSLAQQSGIALLNDFSKLYPDTKRIIMSSGVDYKPGFELMMKPGTPTSIDAYFIKPVRLDFAHKVAELLKQ